jgi:hypothetical protein
MPVESNRLCVERTLDGVREKNIANQQHAQKLMWEIVAVILRLGKDDSRVMKFEDEY